MAEASTAAAAAERAALLHTPAMSGEPGRLAPQIERLAFDAWPAAEVAAFHGWQLRFAHGVTNRANSVWAGRATGSLGLDERIDRVEGFYAERGLPARLHVSPCSEPAGLDAALDARGYRVHAPVTLLVADAASVARAGTPRAGLEGFATDALDDAWFSLSGRQGRYRGEASRHYRGILERAREVPVFVRVDLEGEPAGVGLGVGQGDWMGVFSMLTLPAARRRGVARCVLAALAGQARARGFACLYLQVEADNRPAQELYAGSGFRLAYRTHYRLRELG